MKFMKKLEDKVFNKITKGSSGKELVVLKKVRKVFTDFMDNFIKPITIGIGTFYIFNRIRTKYGVEQVYFIVAVLIIILLRNLNRSINKLIE